MEVILVSIFSAIVIIITVFCMMKAIITAYKRNEISLRKFVVYSTLSMGIGVIVASVLPFGYQRIFDYIYLQT